MPEAAPKPDADAPMPEKDQPDAETASEIEPVKAESSEGSVEASSAGTKVPECPPVKPEPSKGPKVSHDWYQTETSVVVEVRVKGVKAEDVSADISTTGLNLSIKLDANRDYLLDLHLAHPVVPEKVGVDFPPDNSPFCYFPDGALASVSPHKLHC